MRRFISIQLVSNSEDLASAMRSRLVERGYDVRVVIEQDSDTSLRVGEGFCGNMEQLFLVQSLLAPLPMPPTHYDKSLGHAEIRLTIRRDEPIGDAEIFCSGKDRDEVSARVEAAGIMTVSVRESSPRQPAIAFRSSPVSAAMLAWSIGMPPEETMLVCDPSLPCDCRILWADNELVFTQRRKSEAIVIRADDENAALQFAEYLTGLGYRIRHTLVDRSCVDGGLGLIYRYNYTDCAVRMPSFQWLLEDLQHRTRSWLSGQGVNLEAFPFEAEKRTGESSGVRRTIMVDLPIAAIRAGALKPYAKGFPGRYPFTIHAPDPEDARVQRLRRFLIDELGANEVDVQENHRVRKHRITFGREMWDEADMSLRIASLYQEHIADECSARDLFVERSLTKHGVVIHLPPRERPDRSRLRIRIVSNDTELVDWIDERLKRAGHSVKRDYASACYGSRMNIVYGRSTSSEEVAAVEQLLRPLVLEWRGDDKTEYDIEIHYLIDLLNSERDVLVYTTSEQLMDVIHHRLRRKYFELAGFGFEDIQESKVLYPEGKRTVAGYVAWAAGLPDDVGFELSRDNSRSRQMISIFGSDRKQEDAS